MQNWDHCITFWAFKITCQSKFTVKTCEMVKQNLSSVSLNQDTITDQFVLKNYTYFSKYIVFDLASQSFYPELLFFFQVRNFPILNPLLQGFSFSWVFITCFIFAISSICQPIKALQQCPCHHHFHLATITYYINNREKCEYLSKPCRLFHQINRSVCEKSWNYYLGLLKNRAAST